MGAMEVFPLHPDCCFLVAVSDYFWSSTDLSERNIHCVGGRNPQKTDLISAVQLHNKLLSCNCAPNQRAESLTVKYI